MTLRYFKPLALLAFAAFAAEASAQTKPQDFDISPKDGWLYPAEMQEFEAEIRKQIEAGSGQPTQSISVYAALHYRRQIAEIRKHTPEEQPVPIKAFEPYPGTDCTNLKFYLRNDIQTDPIIGCNGLFSVSKGAGLSFSEDYEGDKTALIVNGGLAIPFYRGGGGSREDVFADEYALSFFVQADGTYNDTKSASADDDGYFRTGLKGDFAFGAGNDPKGLDQLLIASSLYYHSDFGTNGYGYGLQVSAVPQKATWHLNALPELGQAAAANKSYYYFNLVGTIDGFQVGKEGGTGLVSGDDYVWFGGTAGLTFFDRHLLPNGLKLYGQVSAFRNLAADHNGTQDAVLYQAGIDFLLDPKGTTSLTVAYEHGKRRQDLKQKDQITVGFKIKH